MPDTYTEPANVEWRDIGILREEHGYRYHFKLPRPLADWDVYDYWESARVYHMAEHLKPGMVLYDVGAEHGWCSLIYASMVGPENMVLIEPTAEFWPNIRHTWEQNYGHVMPRACYQGLVGDVSPEAHTPVFFDRWPDCSNGALIGCNKYQYLHDHAEYIEAITLDDLVDRSGVAPDALTIDVEGAELNVLMGAQHTLEQHHPQIWVSIHPDLMERDYQTSPEDVYDYLGDLGYVGKYLATDHEQHHHFA